MPDSKRQNLKQKVAAAQQRNEARERTLLDRAGETAIEAKDKFTSFAKEHPIATVAGGLALGVLIASFFQGPRRAAAKGGTKLAGLATLGAELAAAYAAKALDAAQETGRDGADWLGDTSRSLGRSAREWRDDAAAYAASARDGAVRSGKSAARAVRGRLN
jgi:hypothetical protein